ncbi:hypothetical protein BDW_04645 [Bdellovibrio bacteriovorus W]|nr:hypothetical protein BDW_04645 [Bdellovibrio bacteriovorus W]
MKKLAILMAGLMLTGCLGEEDKKPLLDLNPLNERVSKLEQTSGGVVGHRHDISEIDGLTLDFNSLTNTPAGFTHTAHTHDVADITGLSLEWSSINNKPLTFAPTAHNHEISEVEGLQSALDSKVNTSALAAIAVTGNYSDLSGKPVIPTTVSELTNDAGYLTSSSSLDGGNVINSVATSVNATEAVNFTTGNTAAAAAGAEISVSGLKAGGSYSIIIEDTTVRLYLITATQCASIKYVNSVESSAGPSIFTIIVSASLNCYVSFVGGLYGQV